MTRAVYVGGIKIGGGANVVIQSMTNTPTADIEATAAQAKALKEAGAAIVRVTANDIDGANAIGKISELAGCPIVADVHFDAKLAVAAMEAGAAKVRINPGNIGSKDKIAYVADAAKAHNIPIRVGANSGSIASGYALMDRVDALVESAMENVRALEECGFYDIVISVKASNAAEMVHANRKLAKLTDYPLHLGVTEAGLYESAIIKSSIGIGSLLIDGIGDTIRVSVTGDPLLEVPAAKDILRFAGRLNEGVEIISCPTCGRTKISVEALAREVSERTAHITKPVKVAVMGCAVNGPGEAKAADIGIAGGAGEGLIFVKGEIIEKLPEDRLVDRLLELLEEM